MTNSSHNRFEEFGFREEDELVEKLDVNFQSKLSNPKFPDSPSLKYNFLACVAHGSDFHAKGSVGVKCVDIDSIDDDDDDEHCSVNVAMPTLTIPVVDGASRPLLGYDSVTDAAFELRCQNSENIYVHRSSISDMDGRVSSPVGHIPENDHIRSPLGESPTNSGSVNSTSSSPVLGITDRSCSSPDVCADLRAEDHAFRGLDVEETEPVVALHADYIAYKGKFYPASLITFSEQFINIESSVVDKDVGALMFEWAVDDDIVSIESQWYARSSVVKVRIHVLANAMGETEKVHDASGIEALKVMLFDPEWFLSLEKIMSLNVRYKAAWSTLAPSDIVDDGDALRIDESEHCLKPYFPIFDEHFDEVVYPEGDVDAVSISKRDVDLLQPETFINDTIIDFYIKYLKNNIPAVEMCRFHFFNSFFFRKLADLDKNPDSAFDGKAAFQRVRKWTRKLNLFEKDYIFIPVNYNLHWSLIVICHPGEVVDFAAEKLNESSRVPCVLHMDSIRGNHTGLKNLIQSYLFEEWKERQKETSEDFSSKFLNLRFLSLELPQQENYYDCGLFLLHYVELFVKDAPVNFNPFNITKFSNFLTADWFIPADVSLKRAYLRRLIHDICANCSQGSSGISVSAEGSVDQSSKLEDDNGNDNGVELISVSCSLQNTSVDSLYSGPCQGIDMNLQWRSPDRSSQCTSEPGLAFRDLFEPGTCSVSLFDQYQRYGLGSYGQPRATMSPIEEEDDEDDVDPLYSRQLDVLTSEGGNVECFRTAAKETRGTMSPIEEEDDEDDVGTLYSKQLPELTSEGYFRTASWDGSFDQEEHDEEDESSPDSDYESDDEEVKVIEDNSQIAAQNEKSDAPKCSLVENFDSVTDSFASASSEMMETPCSDAIKNEQEDHIPSVGENEHRQLSQVPEDQGVADEDEGLIVNDSSLDSEELQPAKRLRLTPLDGEPGTETEVVKDIPL